MNINKLSVYFDESQADITIENHDDQMIVLCVTDMKVNEEKSTADKRVVEPYTISEVYLSLEEARSIANAIDFMTKESR